MVRHLHACAPRQTTPCALMLPSVSVLQKWGEGFVMAGAVTRSVTFRNVLSELRGSAYLSLNPQVAYEKCRLALAGGVSPL